MLLGSMQNQLAALYDTPLDYRVADFLITDATLAAALHGGDNCHSQHNSERVLLQQNSDCLDLSLYIDASVLSTLDAHDPYAELNTENLNDFLIALEGVSHFNYIVWNAVHEREISQLELEIQAEVDKYIHVMMLIDAQGKNVAALEFHHALFEGVQFDVSGGVLREQRYRAANRYAGKYCRHLNQRFPGQHREASFMNEIRRFYRLPQQQKIRSIDPH